MNISRLRRRAAAYHFWGILIRVATVLSFVLTSAMIVVPAFLGTSVAGIVGVELAEPGTLDTFAEQGQPLTSTEEAIIAVSVAVSVGLMCLNILPHSLFWFLSIHLIGKSDELLDEIDMATAGYPPQRKQKRRRQPVYDDEWDDEPVRPRRRAAKLDDFQFYDSSRPRRPRFEDPPERRERFVYDRDFDD